MLSDPSNKDMCKVALFKVQMIETIEEIGWTNRGTMDRKYKTELDRVKFSSLTKTNFRTRRMKYSYENNISGKEFLFKLNKTLLNNLPNSVNFLCIRIVSLNKQS